MSACFPLTLTCLHSSQLARNKVLEVRQVFRPNDGITDPTVQDYDITSRLLVVPASTASIDLLVPDLYCGLVVIQALYPITILGTSYVETTANNWSLPNTSFMCLSSNPNFLDGYISSIVFSYDTPVLVNGDYPDNEVEVFLVRTVAIPAP